MVNRENTKVSFIGSFCLLFFGIIFGVGTFFPPGATAEETGTVGQGKPTNKGIGPVKELKLPDTIDEELAKKGKGIFDSKCTSCHKFQDKYVGPALSGIMNRRTPEWIANMIMNPVEMTQSDPDASALLAELLIPMANQNVSLEETKSIIEYFRRHSAKGDFPAEKSATKKGSQMNPAKESSKTKKK